MVLSNNPKFSGHPLPLAEFRQLKPFTVGLGYTHGFLEDLEPEDHDEPLDAILNDNGVVWPVG